MKTLLGLALLTVASQAAAQDLSCQMAKRDSFNYRIHITIVGKRLTIIQEATTAQYAPLRGTLTEIRYSSEIVQPDLSCSETRPDGTTIRILKSDKKLQVYQSSPTARYRPVEYKIK